MKLVSSFLLKNHPYRVNKVWKHSFFVVSSTFRCSATITSNLLSDYNYFENYIKKFCKENRIMEEIDYSELSKNEEMIVPTVWNILRKEAEIVAEKEILMKPLVDEAILQHTSFKDALSYRLATKLGGHLIPVNQWIKIFQEAYSIKQHDFQYDLENAACLDLVAVKDRDPACDKLFTAFMFFKGYKALQIYRVSHVLWMAGRKELASVMQSRTSEVFAVDIHPGAKIGRGLMIDHASGLVIGETAVVGEHCSFLHGVTLGATGKDSGDRHPKIGNNVSIGCNASIIGNIRIGNNVKIGSGSVVIKPVPDDCTAVGSPARILPPKDPPAGSAVHVTEKLASQSVEKVEKAERSHPEAQNLLKFSTMHVSSDFKANAISVMPNTCLINGQLCNPKLINLFRLIDIGNLPENIILLVMPLFLIYTLISTTGCS